jgi:hypothetical protein
VLPHIAREVRIEDATDDLLTYTDLGVEDAIALVRAARMYQRGIWNADADAGLAWLEIVGAIEVAAVHRRQHGVGYTRLDVVERVRTYAPRIIEAAETGGDAESVRRVAAAVAHLVASADRFVQFLETFLPPEPTGRPTHFALDWSDLADRFRAVYVRRSEALHAGIPIPWPMTMAPRETDGVFEEYSGGLGSWSAGNAYWPADETPMYLNTFAYIARGALRRWWRSMVPTASR